MSILTIRLPDDTAQRLKSLAAHPQPVHEQIGEAAQRARADCVGHGEPFSCHGSHRVCAQDAGGIGQAGRS